MEEPTPTKPAFELIPLKAEQHPVSRLPKRTTELPFFYLTKQKELLNKPVRYEGVDESGNPIRWTVTPNTLVGAPAIDAHEIWLRLIVPTIEIARSKTGRVPEILPLGGMRESLRTLGWNEGGHQARQLLRGLHKIQAASCDADFLLPARDKNGQVTFVPIKGIYSRLSIYAIGDKHLTDDDLSSGKFDFDFDLDATLYVQFHRLELATQQNQEHRYIDNQYMFSVEPRARRWLEIVGPKLFGVVKNNGGHCDVRYSWYVKHHHTLKRVFTRREAAHQMNKVAADHIASGYILKPDYRPLHDPDQPPDFLIRYYPGPRAHESISRIRRHLPHRGARAESGTAINSSPLAKKFAASGGEIDPAYLAELTRRGITEAVARDLVSALKPNHQLSELLEWGDEQVRKNPAAFRNPAGFYVTLIRQNFAPPPTFETGKQRTARRAREDAKEERAHLELAYDDYRRDEIERYISMSVAPEEFEQLTRAKEIELRRQHKSLPDRTIAGMARLSARFEIGGRMSLPTFEEFCDRKRRSQSTDSASAEAA